MASCLCFCSPTPPSLNKRPNSYLNRRRFTRMQTSVVASSNQKSDDNSSRDSTKLLTFLGKGGSGKTTAAVFAAQHFAMAGLATCLVLHSQDPTAEYLLNCKLGTSPTLCSNNLSAIRLETTKMLLDPLKQLKEADARLNITQGVLEGIVGEELGVLPGMDSIFSALALERLVRFFGGVPRENQQKDNFDIIIYDGISSDEFLRIIGAPSKARLYLKYFRTMAEKTELGRLAGPSIMRLVDESMGLTSSRPLHNGRSSSEIWDALEEILERGSSSVAEQHGCFLVMDPANRASVESALRYWGRTLQAGAKVSGAFASASHMDTELLNSAKNKFSPLPFASVPEISVGSDLNWNDIMLDPLAEEARNTLSSSSGHNKSSMPSVNFDMVQKTVTLLMPGFDKSEIKLYQYRGGSELLVEAGDQRRVIHLPSKIQGKVAGAKFIDRSIVIKMK